MSNVVDHIAYLTGLRDRDLLDVTLAKSVMEMIGARLVAVRRVVGSKDRERLFTRSEIHRGELTPRADSMWMELDALPDLLSIPGVADCVRGNVFVGEPLDDHDGVRWCFPLNGEHGVFGVLQVDLDVPLTPEVLRVMEGVVKIYSNFHGVLESGERDTLTGLLNRRTFDALFFRTASRGASSSPRPVLSEQDRRVAGASVACVAVIDIDHFKRVNDVYGHLIGDEVLLLTARLMRSLFRFGDMLFRFGGEEFVVMSCFETLEDAMRVFERFRQQFERYAFPQVGKITISIGVTRILSTDTPPSAFERADKAVYWVKENGRNQVAEYESLIDKGALVEVDRSGDIDLF